MFPFEAAGEPGSRTLLTDRLNALAIGVDRTEAKDVTLDKVFFLLLSTFVTFSVALRVLESSSSFLRLRFR